MSKGWAAIVYGRTYHLDFRFITIPQDFTSSDRTWASTHIVATTQQARNLAGSPRWSLFKNDSHCVVGVTCTIKDLTGKAAKDDRGRPLYAFVGYVTRLTSDRKVANLPPYSDRLDNFKILDREIERVWQVKDYEPDSRNPALSQYYPIDFINPHGDCSLPSPQLNSSEDDAEKIYLWANNLAHNKLLWQASAQSPVPLATCLNIKGKPLTNSPFLNQSNQQTEHFQILERVLATGKYHRLNTAQPEANKPNLISQKITSRAKEDIDLTLQQAAKVALAAQELINNLADTDSADAANLQQDNSTDNLDFGFKKKPSKRDSDWF